jgi:hypothetical protein
VALVQTFLGSAEILRDLQTWGPTFMMPTGEDWSPFFLGASGMMERFMAPLKLDSVIFRKMVRQLHSRCTEKLPFSMFVDMNGRRNFEAKDKEVRDVYDDLMTAFMKESYSPALQRIFAAPSCSRPALNILTIGTSFGTPLERLTKIGECVTILQDILVRGERGLPGRRFPPTLLVHLTQCKVA